MLFNSYEYIFLFLPISVMLYFFLQSKSLTTFATVTLVVCSLFFYGWWNPIYLPLISMSIIFNYLVGNYLHHQEDSSRVISKIVLTLGIAANLALLGYFKYADFFISNTNYLFDLNISSLHLALPLAISFFTFQQIAYLVDCKRKEVIHRGFINYAAFVSFFPQLIAGPIVHNKEMMPQFASDKNRFINIDNISLGIFIFSIGLFKKVVIADSFAVWANLGFSTSSDLQLVEAWVVSLSYGFQLYFDFSGYTDMAVGSALLFNIKLPVNFNSPYKALDLQDFWRRWHMTLSRFIRDYIYIPLGGSKDGEFRTITNLMTAFLLGGLWHGAGWTFVFWGFLHGVGLCAHRIWKRAGYNMWKWAAWMTTFIYVLIAWVFFRAEDFSTALRILSGMAGGNGIALPEAIVNRFGILTSLGVETGDTFFNLQGDRYSLLWVVSGLFVVLLLKNSVEKQALFRPSLLNTLITVICIVCSVLLLNRVSEFLYFNF